MKGFARFSGGKPEDLQSQEDRHSCLSFLPDRNVWPPVIQDFAVLLGRKRQENDKNRNFHAVMEQKGGAIRDSRRPARRTTYIALVGILTPKSGIPAFSSESR
jgi:hypothetical protein